MYSLNHIAPVKKPLQKAVVGIRAGEGTTQLSLKNMRMAVLPA